MLYYTTYIHYKKWCKIQKGIKKMAITTQDIHAAADKLAEQNIKPTLAKVRDALGSGSFTTISDAMATWRQEQQADQQLQQVDLPNSIDERLQALGAEMWQSANGLANERLAAEREALAVAQAAAQQQLDEHKEVIKTLELEQVELLEQLDLEQSKAQQAADDATQSKAALETATTQHSADLNAVKQHLSDTQHKLELEQQRAATVQQAADDIRAKLDETSAELTQSKERIATADAQSIAQQAEIERLKSELADAKALNDKKDAKIDALTDERNELKAELAKNIGRLETTAEQLAALTADHKQLTSDNKALSVDVSTLTADKDTLSKTVSTLTAERDKLTNAMKSAKK
jgi:chromosome segregation ATPase